MPELTMDPTQQCPAAYASRPQRKTARAGGAAGPAIERDAHGVWHVRGFREAQTVLRSPNAKQAGFRAELLERMPSRMRPPILYQQGAEHHTQRKQTARFFTPKAVSSNYRAIMEALAEQLVARLRQTGRADLSELSLTLAVRVVAEVLGLTASRLPGMTRRLNAFFAGEVGGAGRGPRDLLHAAQAQWRLAVFYWLDVRPAILARRRQPREDVISHLLAQSCRDSEILTECVTFGAAGMVTTREFITVAAWHLLEQPALRARYLAAPEAERQQILLEILRLEPVVSHLYRRALAPMAVESSAGSVEVPAGALIDLHIAAANSDPAVVGADALTLCPGRPLQAEQVTPAVLSFGDGAHRCPGSYLAIQETDILLTRLLALDGLQLEREPTLRWNDLVSGYELRQCWLRLAA